MALVLFMRDASLYVILKNKRVTLAVIGVKNNYTSVATISYLLTKVNSLKSENQKALFR